MRQHHPQLVGHELGGLIKIHVLREDEGHQLLCLGLRLEGHRQRLLHVVLSEVAATDVNLHEGGHQQAELSSWLMSEPVLKST